VLGRGFLKKVAKSWVKEKGLSTGAGTLRGGLGDERFNSIKGPESEARGRGQNCRAGGVRVGSFEEKGRCLPLNPETGDWVTNGRKKREYPLNGGAKNTCPMKQIRGLKTGKWGENSVPVG